MTLRETNTTILKKKKSHRNKIIITPNDKLLHLQVSGSLSPYQRCFLRKMRGVGALVLNGMSSSKSSPQDSRKYVEEKAETFLKPKVMNKTKEAVSSRQIKTDTHMAAWHEQGPHRLKLNRAPS